MRTQQKSLSGTLLHRARIMLFSVLIMPVTCGFAAENQYLLGVFPHLPSRELEAVFSPIAAEFGKAISKPVRFRSTSSYAKFIERIDEQLYDFAFMQPFDYVDAAKKYGYLPLATRDEPLSAIVAVRSDSPINSLEDLKGKIVALPPQTAAVSRLTKATFHDLGFAFDQDIRFSHTLSHSSCLQQVLIKLVDACGTAAPALRFFQKEMAQVMRIVGESKAIPHSLFVVHPRVPESERQKVLATILSWGNTEEGRKILQRGAFMPFKVISDQDYDVVRAMARD